MTTFKYSLEDYAFAESEFYTYRRRLADYVVRLSDAAALLREHTDEVTVAGFGLAPQPGDAPVIDGPGLPGSLDIHRTLECYRGAYHRLRTTWDGLNPAQRQGLRSPPSGLPTLRPVDG
jgi:hypothetical protein